MPKKYVSNKKPLNYQPTEEERTAYLWGIDNGYIIGPFGINGDDNNYRLGIATTANPRDIKYDPKIYPHDEVMQKTYEYYKFYYDKHKNL